MSHLRRAIMEEHRASMKAYKKVHNETVRSELRMAIVQQSMEMDMWEIKEKLDERREQMAIRAYEEDKRRKEWIQKIEEENRTGLRTWKSFHCSLFLCFSSLIIKLSAGSYQIGISRFVSNWNQKIKDVINLIQSFIRNPISPPVTTKVPSKPIQNTPRFEEKSGEGYTSSKEVKDSRFISADVTKVADEYDGKNLPQTDSTLKDSDKNDTVTCIEAPKSANSQDNMNPTCAGDQSRIPEKDVPSHGPRKQHMGGQIFGAGLELTVGFNLRAFEELNYVLRRGQERRTWNPGSAYHQSGRNILSRRNILSGLITNVSQQFELLADRHEKRIVQRRLWDPGITHRDILKQHLEDKVFWRTR
ncbi:hypothetical protein Tco_0648281 [Tanacetum coccineum]